MFYAVCSSSFGHFHINILVFLGNISIFVMVTHLGGAFTYIYIKCDPEQRSSRSNPTWVTVTSAPASSLDAPEEQRCSTHTHTHTQLSDSLGPLIQIMKNLTKLWEDTVSAAESLMFTQPEKIEGNQLKTVFTLSSPPLPSLCSPTLLHLCVNQTAAKYAALLKGQYNQCQSSHHQLLFFLCVLCCREGIFGLIVDERTKKKQKTINGFQFGCYIWKQLLRLIFRSFLLFLLPNYTFFFQSSHLSFPFRRKPPV